MGRAAAEVSKSAFMLLRPASREAARTRRGPTSAGWALVLPGGSEKQCHSFVEQFDITINIQTLWSSKPCPCELL